MQRWVPVWKEIRDYLYPYIGNFEGEEDNSSDRPDDKLLDTRSIKFCNIFAAGMQNGVNSPTSDWLKLGVTDEQVDEDSDAQNYFTVLRDTAKEMFARGLFYPEQHKGWGEVGTEGTAAMFVEEDSKTAVHFHMFTIGEFALGCDDKGKHNQFARRIQMTPSQMVSRFGEDKVPQQIKSMADKGNQQHFTVKHLIVPNVDFEQGKLDSFEWSDYYWCDGSDDFLAEGGYHSFPVAVMTYQRKGSDVYGRGPGWWALGDAKQVQLMTAKLNRAIELGVDPPLQAAANALQGKGINALPSGVTLYNAAGADAGVKPLYAPTLDIKDTAAMIESLEGHISDHFSNDVFAQLSMMDKKGMTATEVVQRTSEKMMQLGPLLESAQDYLRTIIERVLEIGFRLNIFPPPPQIIQGKTIQIEFISPLVLAQKQQSLVPMSTLVNSTIQTASAAQRPDLLDKLDFDEYVDQSAMLLGTPPSLIVGDKQVAQIRQLRAQQQAQQAQLVQQQQALQAAGSIAQTAKTASEAQQ